MKTVTIYTPYYLYYFFSDYFENVYTDYNKQLIKNWLNYKRDSNVRDGELHELLSKSPSFWT